MVHVKAHTQEKTFQCSHCNGTFGDSSTLKKHLRTHTGEKPFTCTICDKTFSQSGNLRRHLTVHEKQTPISCPQPVVVEQSHLQQQCSQFETMPNFAFLNNSYLQPYHNHQ